MRTLSPALQAALAAHQPRPVLSLEVEDHRRRLRPLGNGAASSLPHHMLALGGSLLRCCLQSGGLYWAVVADLADETNWPPVWQLAVSDGAIQAGDVALSVAPAHPDRWLVAYQQLSGAIRVAYTEDVGTTWATPFTAATAEVGASIALAGSLALYNVGGTLYARPCRNDLGTPIAWSGGRALNPDLPAFAAVQGLAACPEPGTDAGYLCLACLDGALYGFRYNLASETLSDLAALLPGGDAPASALAKRCLPALCIRNTAVYATVLDAFGDSDLTAWMQPLLLGGEVSRFPRMARLAAPDMACTQEERVVPAVLASGERAGWLFLADQGRGMVSPAYSAAENRLGALVPSQLSLQVDEGGSRLSVQVPNCAGWLTPQELPACQPLAEVRAYRGLWTAGGVETSPLPPHYLTRVEVSAEALLLEAVDGLGLLARVHPAETLVYQGRTLGYIAEELAALANLEVMGSSAALEMMVPRYALAPNRSAGEALVALLGDYGLGARCDTAGRLQVIELGEPAAANLTLAASDLLDWRWATTLPEANTVRVLGGEGEGLLWSAGTGAGLNSGLLLPQVLTDETLCSEAQVRAKAEALWQAAQASTGEIEVVLHLHPALEWGDTVSLRGVVRRVQSLSERWVAGKRVWESVLVLG